MAPQGEARTVPTKEPLTALMAAQAELFQQTMANQLFMLEQMRAMGNRIAGREDQATFKTRITSGGRISIPDAEREALNLQEGDLVQVVLIPVRRGSARTSEE